MMTNRWRQQEPPQDSHRKPAGRKTGILLVTLLSVTVCLSLLLAGMARAQDERPARQNSPAAPYQLQTTKRDFLLPGTQPHTLIDEIPSPESCRTCHSQPIYGAWRGSMMSQAGRDPIFWAALHVANNDAANAGEFCLRCHVPKGWLEGRSDPADGSAFTPLDIGAGVACEVCHRMVDPVPGANDQTTQIDIAIRSALTVTLPADFVTSAMMIVDPQDNRRGPFALPDFGFHTAYQSRFQGQSVDAVAHSRLCGTCHNVDNPALSWVEKPPGGGPAQYWPNELDTPAPSYERGDMFPIERTFDEWFNSQYAKGGVVAPQFAGAKPNGLVESCQDCHMPRQTGQAAIPSLNPVFRDCVTTGCLPAHVLVGGNTWAPQLLQDPRWRLHNGADAPYLAKTAEEARAMLKKGATVMVALGQQGNQKVATVRVTNETGHKLPTGYPEGRRIWINLRAYDVQGKLVYESGVYDWNAGTLKQDAGLKVYEAEPGLTPELAKVLGMDSGPTFHFALNNAIFKDNRIPPRGYTVAAFDQPGLRPVGVTFKDGQHWDDTTYVVPAGADRVVATLYYQTSSSEYIAFLREKGGADGATLGEMWDDSKSPPEVMAIATAPTGNRWFVPVVGR